MKHKRHRKDRKTTVLRAKRDSDILVPFYKRDMMPMKDCSDCQKTCILAVNGMFGCPRCKHYFK